MRTDNANLRMMRHEKIPKVLFRLGIPTMIGLLVTTLYNVVDTYFMSGLGTARWPPLVYCLGFCFLNQLLLLLGITETIPSYAKEYGVFFIVSQLFSVFKVTVNQTISSEGAARVTM
jgi:Na+-driven multidrug efflux pump